MLVVVVGRGVRAILGENPLWALLRHDPSQDSNTGSTTEPNRRFSGRIGSSERWTNALESSGHFDVLRQPEKPPNFETSWKGQRNTND